MTTRYEKIYRAQRQALGAPTKAFVNFFHALDGESLKVLDLGCGQGRDALFIARLGHKVRGVDSSPTGIGQLLEDAEREGLQVRGEVADLKVYRPEDAYDIVLFDRTLHMLEETVRLRVLKEMTARVAEGGYLLIADERKNLPAMRALLKQDQGLWQTLRDEKGLLFVQKTAQA